MVELRFISQGLYSQDDRRLLMELFRITPVAALSRQVMNRELAVDHYRNTLLNNDKYTEQYDVEFLSKTITLAAHTRVLINRQPYHMQGSETIGCQLLCGSKQTSSRDNDESLVEGFVSLSMA